MGPGGGGAFTPTSGVRPHPSLRKLLLRAELVLARGEAGLQVLGLEVGQLGLRESDRLVDARLCDLRDALGAQAVFADLGHRGARLAGSGLPLGRAALLTIGS